MFEKFTPKCMFFGLNGETIAYITDGSKLETGQMLYSTDDGETIQKPSIYDYYGTANLHSFITVLDGRRVLITRDRDTVTRYDNHTFTFFRLSSNKVTLN